MKRVCHGKHELVEQPTAVGPDHPVTSHFMTNSYHNFQRELAFPETSDEDAWRSWRVALRARLRGVLHLDAWGDVRAPEFQVMEELKRDGYVRRKLAYQTVPGNWAVAYLLVPNGLSSPAPAVICPHGHVPGAKLGVADPEKASANGYGMAYGHELARRGFVVLAPDNAGMGERDVATRTAESIQSGCNLLFRRLNHVGLDLTGLRVFDLMVGVSLLSSLSEVDSSRIGCAGLSGGCWLSQVLTALDDRIRAVILSGFFTTFVQTVWHEHCICHHPLGIGRLCDMPDLSALIAPRPQFVESGRQDNPYPCEPAYSMVRRAYALLGAEEHLVLHEYEGGHMFHGGRSIPWMVEQLRAPLPRKDSE